MDEALQHKIYDLATQKNTNYFNYYNNEYFNVFSMHLKVIYTIEHESFEEEGKIETTEEKFFIEILYDNEETNIVENIFSKIRNYNLTNNNIIPYEYEQEILQNRLLTKIFIKILTEIKQWFYDIESDMHIYEELFDNIQTYKLNIIKSDIIINETRQSDNSSSKLIFPLLLITQIIKFREKNQQSIYKIHNMCETKEYSLFINEYTDEGYFMTLLFLHSECGMIIHSITSNLYNISVEKRIELKEKLIEKIEKNIIIYLKKKHTDFEWNYETFHKSRIQEIKHDYLIHY